MKTLNLVIGSGLLLGAFAAPAWYAAANLGYLAKAELHSRRLDDDRARFMKSARIRQQLTEDVLAGRRTLQEAARGYRAAGAGNRPSHLVQVLDSFPGTSANERAAGWVLSSVKMAAGDTPNSHDDARIDQLEIELAGYEMPPAADGGAW
jgi:hypothetical protein